MAKVETENTRAEGLADCLVDAVKYYADELAGDEAPAVRNKALRLMARRILRDAHG